MAPCWRGEGDSAEGSNLRGFLQATKFPCKSKYLLGPQNGDSGYFLGKKRLVLGLLWVVGVVFFFESFWWKMVFMSQFFFQIFAPPLR